MTLDYTFIVHGTSCYSLQFEYGTLWCGSVQSCILCGKDVTKRCSIPYRYRQYIPQFSVLTHWGRVTQICVFTLQLCKTD